MTQTTMTSGMNTVIAGLDVGTSKTVCLIAERSADGALVVRGMGMSPTEGMKEGAVRDPEAVERAIRSAVSKAEKMARLTVSDVIVSLTGGRPASQILELEVDLAGDSVTEEDVSRVLQAARDTVEVPQGRVMIQASAAAFAIDGDYDKKPPVGLFGKKLGVSLHVITVDEGPLRNLEMSVRRAQLDVAAVVVGVHAAALAVMVEDEINMGAACVDMGEGSTGLALFALGSLVHVTSLPVGGCLMTQRLMRSLLTTHDTAESLKTRSGSAICDASDASSQIEVVRIGDGFEGGVEARSLLTSEMQQEYEQQLAQVGRALEASGFTGYMGQRLVLTGGAAQATRLSDLADRQLGRDIRIGEAMRLAGLPESACSPAFACAVGLLLYGAEFVESESRKRRTSERRKGGPLSRLFGWMRETF